MENENKQEESLIIEDTKEDFNYWINRHYIDSSKKKKLVKSNLMIIPREGFAGREDICFPVGTLELFHFLEKQKNDEFKPEICFGDENYKELALHADLILIGSFIVTNLILPLFVNYLYDYFKNKYGKSLNKRNVKLEITYDEGDTHKKLTYEGPGKDFNKQIVEGLKKLKK